MRILFSCIALCLLTAGESGLFTTQKLGVIDRYKRDLQLRVVKYELRQFADRIPGAVAASAVEYVKGYTTTTAIMLPVEMVVNVKQYKSVGMKRFLARSLQKASSWGKYSGSHHAIEAFLAEIRKRRDRWNSIVASGVTNALSKPAVAVTSKSKPTGVIRSVMYAVKSFGTGFGLAVAVDKLSTIEMSSPSRSGGGRATKASSWFSI